MKKIKKIILASIGIITTLGTTAAMISCGNNKTVVVNNDVTVQFKNNTENESLKIVDAKNNQDITTKLVMKKGKLSFKIENATSAENLVVKYGLLTLKPANDIYTIDITQDAEIVIENK